MKEPEKTKDLTGRNNKGRFAPGNNISKGRRKGSKNKKTMLAEVLTNDCEPLLANFTPKVLKLVAEQALEGCRQSQKLFLDRAIPIQKAVAFEDNRSDHSVVINVGLLENKEDEKTKLIEGSFKEET